MSAIFRPFDDLAPPTKRRRDLPHWESPGATYYVTIRLADAIPAGILREIELRATAWLRAHGINDRHGVDFLPAAAQEDFRRTISATEQRWLDAGHGSCVLLDEACRAWVIEAMHHFDGERYTLDDFVIMPNHVHVLVLPHEGWALGEIMGPWKQFAARRINGRMQRTGTLWQHESFDHIVRSWEKLEQCRRYIGANPVKANLRAGQYHLGCGSGIYQ